MVGDDDTFFNEASLGTFYHIEVYRIHRYHCHQTDSHTYRSCCHQSHDRWCLQPTCNQHMLAMLMMRTAYEWWHGDIVSVCEICSLFQAAINMVASSLIGLHMYGIILSNDRYGMVNHCSRMPKGYQKFKAKMSKTKVCHANNSSIDGLMRSLSIHNHQKHGSVMIIHETLKNGMIYKWLPHVSIACAYYWLPSLSYTFSFRCCYHDHGHHRYVGAFVGIDNNMSFMRLYCFEQQDCSSHITNKQ